ncbi:hypothetical protein [Rhodococcus sp. SGAir0479]|uniref:hypothetical protein n=1 Tax=Rhodococcus sp. SGAir0479 TaxID=2567884 RepID=UPI0010CD3FDC|nr:hypothetical protein [Rhodococcus sp. SGAir0479]QCQ93469.1 hypothetical protein E7742_21120 [Rhodococcus sp. SGAir0479]
MQGLAVVLFPALLMLFALAMERVEFRLRRLTVREQEVEEFLDQASQDEVATLASEGFPHALARFHRRRKRGVRADPGIVAPDTGSARRAS